MNRESAAARMERLDRYLAQDPQNARLWEDAIELALQAGQVEIARSRVDDALRRGLADLPLRVSEGHVLLAEGRLEAAAAVFAQLLSVAREPAVACELGAVLIRLDRHAQANEVLTPYAERPQAPCELVTLLLQARHRLGDLQGALDAYRLHGGRCAAQAAFLAAASLLHLDANQLDAAQSLSEAALASAQRPLEALVTAGSLALARDDATRAKALFDEALALDPAQGRSWSGLGLASLVLGLLDDAKTQLERAATLMPSHVGTWHALAWCEIRRGDLAAARRALAEALAVDRNFGETHGALAVVHALSGEREQAQAAIGRALRLDAHGLTARYARMVLAGDISDGERFRVAASRVVASGTLEPSLVRALLRRLH